MNMWQAVILLFLASVFAYKDAENVLAQVNTEGYPESLLYEALQKANKDITTVNEVSLSESLDSEELQVVARKSAVDYAAAIVDKKGMSRGLLDDPSLCENSWVYWLPWFNCPKPKATNKPKFVLIKEQGHKCYKPKNYII